ncbi:MAG: Gfo/Idh/MocA family oxidoreductase, partial [Planctomycetota bacterium]
MTKNANELRLGIIGIGGMGSAHLGMLTGGNPIDRLRVTAIADSDPKKLKRGTEEFAKHPVKGFATPEELMASGEVDAILIATPHYDHPPLAIKGFEHGLHVLSEKPAGVYTKQVKEMNAAAEKAKADHGLTFGIMFNQRTRKSHQQMRKLVQSGELGELRRNMYVLTDWFRTQYYYDTAGWKGTWEGEGGAVLLNQSPHNLDLWQWICGMPKRVRAFCKMGHHHHIETEDEVTAYVEYENGGTGVFVTSTGEAPGTQFMEIAADHGKVVMQGSQGSAGGITYWRSPQSVRSFLDEAEEGFAKPEVWKTDVPGGDGPEHRGILVNFTEAILDEKPLLAPGTDGLNGVALANAMLMSAWKDDWVDLPIDDDEYAAMLDEKIKSSTFVKNERTADTA